MDPVETDERETVPVDDQRDEQQKDQAMGEPSPVADGEGAAPGPAAAATEPLPQDYDILAWAHGVPEMLAGAETLEQFDVWVADPETVARLDRLKDVDESKWNTLSSAAKARRLKLSRAK